MNIKTRIRTALDAFTSSLALTVIENTHGIKMIEALAAESFQTDMANVSTKPEERQAIRDSAIVLAQLGVSGFDDVEEMVRAYKTMCVYDLTVSDIRALGTIKMGRRLA